VYKTFIELYNGCTDGFITYRDLQAYEAVTNIKLSLYEVNLIKQMNSWANDEAEKLKQEQ